MKPSELDLNGLLKLHVEIVSATPTPFGNGIEYTMQIKEQETLHWVISRRYSQFRLLYTGIRKTLLLMEPSQTFPIFHGQFPKKKWLCSNSRRVVKERIRDLHKYMQDLFTWLRAYAHHAREKTQKRENNTNTNNAVMPSSEKRVIQTLLCMIRTFLAIPETFQFATPPAPLFPSANLSNRGKNPFPMPPLLRTLSMEPPENITAQIRQTGEASSYIVPVNTGCRESNEMPEWSL